MEWQYNKEFYSNVKLEHVPYSFYKGTVKLRLYIEALGGTYIVPLSKSSDLLLKMIRGEAYCRLRMASNPKLTRTRKNWRTGEVTKTVFDNPTRELAIEEVFPDGPR